MYSTVIIGEIVKPIEYAVNDRDETLVLATIAVDSYRMVDGVYQKTAPSIVNILQVVPQGRTDIVKRFASIKAGVTVSAVALLDDLRTVNDVAYYAVSDQGFLVHN